MTSNFKKTITLAVFTLALTGPALAGSGSFIGVEGEKVSGKATLGASSVQLSPNFRTSSGPDLYVYLGNNNPTKIIGELKRNSGAQSYSLPKGIDTSKYKNVFIHCKRFNHTFGKAKVR